MRLSLAATTSLDELLLYLSFIRSKDLSSVTLVAGCGLSSIAALLLCCGLAIPHAARVVVGLKPIIADASKLTAKLTAEIVPITMLRPTLGNVSAIAGRDLALVVYNVQSRLVEVLDSSNSPHTDCIDAVVAAVSESTRGSLHTAAHVDPIPAVDGALVLSVAPTLTTWCPRYCLGSLILHASRNYQGEVITLTMPQDCNLNAIFSKY